MSHPRLAKHRQRKQENAEERLHQAIERAGDRQRYADLLRSGKANLDTIRELNQIGQRIGKSPEQIELDALTLARAVKSTA